MAEPHQNPQDLLSRSRLKDLAAQACLVTPSDRIRVYVELAAGVAAAVTTVTVLVGGRVLGFDGQLSTFQESKSYTVDGAQTVFTVRANEGMIIDLSVSTTTDNLQTGDVAVAVDLVQGEGAAATPVSTLATGWVTKIAPLGLYTIQGAF